MTGVRASQAYFRLTGTTGTTKELHGLTRMGLQRILIKGLRNVECFGLKIYALSNPFQQSLVLISHLLADNTSHLIDAINNGSHRIVGRN